jgi:hypothetical protein
MEEEKNWRINFFLSFLAFFFCLHMGMLWSVNLPQDHGLRKKGSSLTLFGLFYFFTFVFFGWFDLIWLVEVLNRGSGQHHEQHY